MGENISTIRPLVIFKGFPTSIISDKGTVKVMSVFFQLKSFYVGGSIHNYRSRYREITDLLKICDSTLRRRIGEMVSLGLVVNDGGNLVFAGRNKIKELFDLSGKSRKVYRLKFDETKNIEKQIVALAIDENIRHQVYALRKKLVSDRIDKLALHDTRISGKLKRSGNSRFEYLSQVQLQRNIKSILKGNTPKINAQTTLSRMGIATLLGMKSKSTGTRWANRLSFMGLIDDLENSVKVKSGISYNSFKNMSLPGKFFFKNGSIYLRLCNSIIAFPCKGGNVSSIFYGCQ